MPKSRCAVDIHSFIHPVVEHVLGAGHGARWVHVVEEADSTQGSALIPSLPVAGTVERQTPRQRQFRKSPGSHTYR